LAQRVIAQFFNSVARKGESKCKLLSNRPAGRPILHHPQSVNRGQLTIARLKNESSPKRWFIGTFYGF
jgi:hypothetical protein